MSNENWQQHRKRWLERVRAAEKKAMHLENEIHNVLDDIDEGNADLDRVHQLLLRAIVYVNTTA